jgi:WD40 repeat protein
MRVFNTEPCLRHDLSFAPDGRRLLVGAPTPVLLDTLGSGPLLELNPPDGLLIAHARLALGGRALVYTLQTEDSSVYVWDLATDRIRVWERAERGAAALAVGPDGTTVYGWSVRSAPPWKPEVFALDVATVEPLGRYPVGPDLVWRLTVSADGRRLVAHGGWNVPVWNLARMGTGPVYIRVGMLGVSVEDAVPSADGSRVATVTNRGVVLWDVSPGNRKVREVFRSGKHRRRVCAVACSPTKPLFATGDNAGQVFLWDFDGRVLSRFDWGLGEVQAMCFAPDGLRCAAADTAGRVVVWDVEA